MHNLEKTPLDETGMGAVTLDLVNLALDANGSEVQGRAFSLSLCVGGNAVNFR